MLMIMLALIMIRVNCHHRGVPFSVFSHPTSCCSAAEIMSVLFFHTMRYKTEDPRNQCNDRFVLSKAKINTHIFFIKCDFIRRHLSWYLFYLVGLGPRCTRPVCSLGRGRFCERVRSAQPAQDWLRPGGPPHARQCRFVLHPFCCLVVSWESKRMSNINFFVLCIFQKLEFVDVATGSLGQGLGAACGMAYTGKNFDKSRLESVEFT